MKQKYKQPTFVKPGVEVKMIDLCNFDNHDTITEDTLMKNEEYHTCEICHTDPVFQNHHIIPKCYVGNGKSVIHCCRDCGNQLHMLFTNKELAQLQLDGVLNNYELIQYIDWKKKHPGNHSYKASRKVKDWKKGHRS